MSGYTNSGNRERTTGCFSRAVALLAGISLAMAASTSFAQDPCIVPDSGGTVTLPPQGCTYLSPTQVHEIINGLPPGTTIILQPIHKDFICSGRQSETCSAPPPPGFCEAPGGNFGTSGAYDCFESQLSLQMTGTGDLEGFTHHIDMPVNCQVHTGPRTAGQPTQQFPTQMAALQGATSDGVFQSLQITAGSLMGLPMSPGQTMLVQQGGPGSNWAVDSFFDITYRIDFVGSPTGPLANLSGTTTLTVHMEARGGEQACCLGTSGGCQSLPVDMCMQQGGTPQGSGSTCGPTVCQQVPDQPCGDCGPGPDWVDSCIAGTDNMPTGAEVGIDMDGDGNPENSYVLFGPALVTRSAPSGGTMQTEMTSMSLTGGGLTLVAGAGNGQGGVLGATLGAITEQPGDPSLADSFFDVFFEVDLGGGNYVYNQSPLHVATVITCVPPIADYIHPQGQVIPLYSSPTGGSIVAYLVDANHGTYPDRLGCCFPSGGCQDMLENECTAAGGAPQSVRCFREPCPPIVVTVPAGDDCWQTTCGATQFDFCHDPIPADFFAPGSLPFDGVILLGGDTGGADTVVQRMADMTFSGVGETQTIPIQLTQLSLASCTPIIVTSGVDGSTTQWSVHVGLSSCCYPILDPDCCNRGGEMTVAKTHPNGGTFSSTFYVQPVFTFTQVGNPTDMRTLDFGTEGIEPVALSSCCGSEGGGAGKAPWVHNLTIPANTCGTNFHPGVEEDTSDGSQCCKPVGHSAGSPPGHIHETAPPDCSSCPKGACCNPADGSCFIAEPSGPLTAGEVCTGGGGTYGGDGSTCADSDGDGLPDFIETNDCRPCPPLPPLDRCHTGTDPNKADTDGDGCSDGQEIADGTNPCDPCSWNPAVCTPPDCDADGIPDCQEPDSDGDGIPDDCDPQEPCSQCGPGPHWIDTCPGGDDSMNTGALVGVDTNADGIADQTLVLFGPASVRRQASSDDSGNYPGTRPIDGHMDVIDTEMLSMSLTGGGVTLTAGAGNGQGGVLGASLGAIAEKPNPSLADSFFDIFFEIDLGGGQFGYNQTPLRVRSEIDCVPPRASYWHPRNISVAIYSAPTGGTIIAHLVEARHDTFPENEACCFADGTCQMLLAKDCVPAGGTPQGPGTACQGDNDGDGIDDACECEPDTTAPRCEPHVCPQPDQKCLPKCVRYNPDGNYVVEVLECDCVRPDECHIELATAAAGPGARGGDPCEVPDDGSGTVTLPPAGCAYLSPDDVHRIIDGLPSGTTIEFAAIHTEFICNRQGSAGGGSSVCSFPPEFCEQDDGSGGREECRDSILMLQLNGTGDLNGFSRNMGLPVSFETHTGPRSVGDPVQSFDTDMFRLLGQLPPGDPDFDLLRITAGTDYGMPSPGHTTLTQLPGGSWAVDSFFDITYRIDFVGAAGGPLAGMSGSTTGTIRMGTGTPALPPSCVGACPPGFDCVTSSTTNADGTVNICCNCVPQTCEPNTAGDGCEPTTCPNAGENCQPTCVRFDASTGHSTVTHCDCGTPDDCHIEFVDAAGGSRGGGSNPCEVPDNGGGTVTLPPAGCQYLSPDDVHRIIDGLPAGTTIEFAPIHTNFICNRNEPGGSAACDPGAAWGVDCTAVGGDLGGERECSDSTLGLSLDPTGTLNGSTLEGRTMTIPVSFETHTAPRTLGPVQSFDTEMFKLQGQIIGDPDFDLLRITAGNGFGLPSPGHTTLTQLPSGGWAVDSFFDITYRIDFVGAPGGPLAGMSGSTTGTIRMQAGNQTPKCVGMTCPTFYHCEQTRTEVSTGVYDLCCECKPDHDCNGNGTADEEDISSGASADTNGNGIPDECEPADCAPNSTGDGCQPTSCANAGEECLPSCVRVNPFTGDVTVTECDCRTPNECHAEFATAAGGGRGGSGNPCTVPDAGSGTVTLPPAGCDYLSPDEVHAIIDGLPAGTTIEFATIHTDFICNRQEPSGGGNDACDPGAPWGVDCTAAGGSLGGERECSQANLSMELTGTGDLAGFTKSITIPHSFETHVGPRTVGDPVQSFDTEMFALQGQLPPGDPDFDLLRITAGSAFGMPSPGHTTLTQLPGGSWAVDSFFDITYRIDFVGAPGGPLAGLSGSTTATIRMATGSGASCVGGCPEFYHCDPTRVVNADGTYDICCNCSPINDCNNNGTADEEDISSGASADTNGNGIPDECEPADCEPNSAGDGCEPTTCPNAGENCQPTCVRFDAATGHSTVTHCDCGTPDDCHIEFVDAAGGSRGGGSNPCEVMDNGSGTVTLPPAGCAYLSPDDVHRIIDGLPAGTTIEFAPIHTNFICNRQPDGGGGPACDPGAAWGVDCTAVGGDLGGERECSQSTVSLALDPTGDLDGSSLEGRTMTIPVSFESHTSPRGTGPVQSFDTEMFKLEGQVIGDPDFDLLRIRAGNGFGLPSPGHTTLTQLPSGNWAVDSFFDIFYEIEFVGAPGGPLAGMSGSTTGTIRMQTGNQTPKCVGTTCPTHYHCETTRTEVSPGVYDLCCECKPDHDCNNNGVADEDDISSGASADVNGNGIPDECEPADCEPNSAGDGCEPTTCPNAGENCQPTCVRFDASTGHSTVTHCDCGTPDDCHIEFVDAAGGSRGGGSNPCEVPDNGGGTVTLPPAGCQYLSPDDVHRIIDGLPAGTTIELAPIHKDFICNEQGTINPVCSFPAPIPGVDCDDEGGSLGGERECAQSTLELHLNGTGTLAGFNRVISVPLGFETHVAPRTPGQPVQSFDTDMFRMYGQITNPGSGDPDFDLLRIVGGTDFGLPSPGHTTLTQLPGGNWAVDSFFDITYRIDFVGRPGGALAGMSGSTTGTIRMQSGNQTPKCVGTSCPTFYHCETTRTEVAPGIYDLCCECKPDHDCNGNGTADEDDISSGASADTNGNGIPDECEPQDCLPNSTGDGCTPSICPVSGQECTPTCVRYDAATGHSIVTGCECRTPNDCHIEFVDAAGGSRGGSNPCEVPDNGSGTVTLPPPGCDYLSPDEVHKIIDGLPPGTTIELAPIHKDFICHEQGTQPGGVCSFPPAGVDCEEPGGTLGGQRECVQSTLELHLDGTGALHGSGLDGRTLSIPVSFETHVGARVPGEPIQSFDTEMFRLRGQITGDPDFDLLRITAGTDFGLPSPGHTTLTQLPGGNWAVDSFFDITYRIDFVGRPGGSLSGMSGSTTGTIRMATGIGAPPSCVGACPPGTVCIREIVTNADGTLGICCNCVAITDCNTNGVDDSTDIASGASRDCNTNGIPDECDIASGFCNDVNHNGRCDKCERVARIKVNRPATGGGRAPDECLDPGSGTNETLVVEISMEGASVVVVAGQFFLSYDNNVLDFVSAETGDDPFTREVYADFNEGAGELDYVVGIQDGDSGTSVDTVMARLTFRVISEECAATAIVAFRDHFPPTRLGGEADAAVEAVTVALTPFTIDGTPPDITAPGDITTNADAGDCSATFTTLPYATATDNCDPEVTITFSRSDGQPNLLDPYAAADSPITITWTAEDDCGNTSTANQVITVNGISDMFVDIELSPNLDDPDDQVPGHTVDRCITFELWACPGDSTPSATVDHVITFPRDFGVPHRANGVAVPVSCDSPFTCVTARDRLHTLRSKAPDFTDDGASYSATFVGNRAVGGHWLVGGNVNDDTFVDVLDFASYVVRFGVNYGTGNTTCSTPFFHVDITGDGIAFTGDFTYISVNFLKFHEPNCCGAAGARRSEPEPRPVLSIAVSELWRRGMGELAAADLNGDGMVDMSDMDAFMAGARPGTGSPDVNRQAPRIDDSRPLRRQR